jgi:hypothetical protein
VYVSSVLRFAAKSERTRACRCTGKASDGPARSVAAKGPRYVSVDAVGGGAVDAVGGGAVDAV